MIAPLPGWTWEIAAGGVLLELEEHPGCAGIRYRERVRPLTPFPALVKKRAHSRKFAASSVGPIRRLVTREGEYGLIATLCDAGGGRRVVAMVCADDWFAELDGIARCPEHAAQIEEIVEELAFRDCHFLGHRRRRFVYTAPPGWKRYAPMALHAHWFPPEFPGKRCLLIVYPALPRQSGADTTPSGELALLTTGPPNALRILRKSAGPEEVRAAGLDGWAWEYECEDDDGAPWTRWVTMLRDDHYAYPVFLDAGADERGDALAALSDLLASIEPLPRPTPARALHLPGLLDHWA